MGFWGTSLYANDITCDVRDSYIEALKKGASNYEAYKQIKEEFIEYIGTDEEPLFWFALAETQWKLGRLTFEVKIQALNWIENDGGLDFWKDSKDKGQGWIKTLIKLRNKLESPMPKEKKIHKEVDFPRNPWNINDIYAYRFNGEIAHKLGLFGKYIIIQKIGNQESYNDWIFSRIHVFDKVFDDIPSITDIDNLRLLPLVEPFIEETGERVKTIGNYMNCSMVYYKKNEYKEKYFTFIGNKVAPDNKVIYKPSSLGWSDIDDALSEWYTKWQGVEYKSISKGIFGPL